MDATRFDRLARSLSSGASRRTLLGVLGSALLASPPRGAAGGVAADGKRRRKRRCRAGRRRCGGRCVDTATDPRNCGGCGTRCQVHGVCERGACTCVKGECADPHVNCCPEGVPVDCLGFPANNENGQFAELGECGATTDCPEAQRCVGPRFQTCCPPGSTCDRGTGTCLR